MVLEYKVQGVGKYMKSSAIGWDSEWGKLKLVTAEGSKTSASMRPFGLDCSGFITWVWRNAGMLASDIGNGTIEQYGNCRPIARADAIPGVWHFTMTFPMSALLQGLQRTAAL